MLSVEQWWPNEQVQDKSVSREARVSSSLQQVIAVLGPAPHDMRVASHYDSRTPDEASQKEACCFPERCPRSVRQHWMCCWQLRLVWLHLLGTVVTWVTREQPEVTRVVLHAVPVLALTKQRLRSALLSARISICKALQGERSGQFRHWIT